VQRDLAPLKPVRIEPLPVKPPEPKKDKDAAPPEEEQGAAYLRDGRYAEALLAWEDAAAKGSAAAALELGMMYDAGVGVPQSYSEALSWYGMAAEKDNLVALFNIGVLYDAGLGQRRNSAEAVAWYERAAAKGSGRAAFNLALHFETGDGVEQDDRQAEQYFKQADRLGVAGARSHLPGRRVRSADAEDADLPFNTVHAIGGDAPERRAAGAVDRLQSEAEQGDPLALYDLAYHLERGIGTEIDLRGAHMRYRKAAYATSDERLKKVADAAAARIKGHLTAAGHSE
jgi:hypothetical protein